MNLLSKDRLRKSETDNRRSSGNLRYDLRSPLESDYGRLVFSSAFENGSRSHTIQEEEIFKGSNIKSFIADRAPLYETKNGGTGTEVNPKSWTQPFLWVSCNKTI